MLNQITIMGRLVKTPELRMTQTQKAVTTFTLAVDNDYKGTDGERKTNFIDVVAWRNTAEFVCKYVVQGDLIVVSGSLQFRDWTDNNNSKHRNAEVLAEHVYFGAKKGANAATNAEPVITEVADDEGELPF